MRLNPDCVRDTLLFLEENLRITPELEIKGLTLHKITEALDYTIEEVANTLIDLKDAGFITAQLDMADRRIYRLSVSRITHDGYQFIETIRPKPVWERTKNILGQMGSFTFETIKTIATQIIKSEISAYLEGNPQIL